MSQHKPNVLPETKKYLKYLQEQTFSITLGEARKAAGTASAADITFILGTPESRANWHHAQVNGEIAYLSDHFPEDMRVFQLVRVLDGVPEEPIKFGWSWFKDGDLLAEPDGHVTVYMEREGKRVEVCRMIPGGTDDCTGCVLRASIVVDALYALAEKQGEPLHLPE